MSEQLKVGQKVKITGKDVQGVIAFIGPTSFAPDLWIGIKLGEPRGKNNGSVQGVEYFKVRQTAGFEFLKTANIC